MGFMDAIGTTPRPDPSARILEYVYKKAMRVLPIPRSDRGGVGGRKEAYFAKYYTEEGL